MVVLRWSWARPSSWYLARLSWKVRSKKKVGSKKKVRSTL